MKRLLLILTLVATVGVGLYSLLTSHLAERSKLRLTPHRLAVVGPMSGKEAAKGAAMVAGARLFAERYTASLTGEQRPIEIVPFDDRNRPDEAERVARAVVSDRRVVAVLGHRSSAASLRAAPLYAEHGLPLVGGHRHRADDHPG